MARTKQTIRRPKKTAAEKRAEQSTTTTEEAREVDFDTSSSPIIYKEDRYWVCRMSVEKGVLEMEYGQVGGKPTKRERKVIPKGKSDMLDQCTQELQQRYKEKVQEGYKPRVTSQPIDIERSVATASSSTHVGDVLPPTQTEENDEDSVTDVATSITTLRITPQQMKVPMLAQKYHERLTKKNGIRYPMDIQPKANGVRGLLVYTDSGVQIYSRTLHSYYFMEALRADVGKLLSLRPDIVLDGELYAPGVAGQHITSMTNQKSTPHPDEHLIQLWLFDCYVVTEPGMLFSKRRELLENLCKEAKCEKVVLMENIRVHNEEELNKVHTRHEKEKWEGTMIRYDAPYQHRRSNDLIKYKFGEEMDTKILDVQRTEGGDIVLKVKTPKGKEFLHRPEGTAAEKEEWVSNPSLVVGKTYSFSYSHLSEDGIPLAIHHGCIRFDLAK
jgi:ATP-dependent DNA ligase